MLRRRRLVPDLRETRRKRIIRPELGSPSAEMSVGKGKHLGMRKLGGNIPLWRLRFLLLFV